MADIDNNINSKLSGFAQKLQEKAALAAPVTPEPPASQNTTPIVLTTPVVAPTQEQVKSVATPPVTEQTPPITTTEPVVEPKAWDDGLFNNSNSNTSEPITFESLSSALKIEGIKSKEDLVEQFNSQQAKIKELETSRDSYLSELDEDFKEVFNIAKQKGDWKGYLATSLGNVNAIDPVQLYENAIDQQFWKDGVFDKDAADAAQAEIPLAVKRVQGEQMKRQMIQEANLRKAAIQQGIQEKTSRFNNALADASRNLPKSLTPDKVGITLENKHSDFIYEGIRNGKLIEKHFGKIDISGADPAKIARTIALAEWGENISRHQFDQGKAKALVEHLNKAQNVQLNTAPIPPQPNAVDLKEPSAADKIRANINRNRVPGGL